MAPTPTRPPGAAARVLVVCLWAALATVVGPVPAAHAWSDGACPDGEGVTVVVDFRSLGGATVVRCAPAPVESGYDALTRVGLDWTPTQRHPGFLCRIEGVPADDPCVNTAPPDAYWSYWRAEPGGNWAYSNYGPSSTSPPPGPVEGWSFSTGTEDQPPRTAPPSPAPEPPPPSPSPSATSDPAPDPEPEPTPTSAPPPPPAEPGPTSPDPAPTTDDGPRGPAPEPTPFEPEPSATDPTQSPSPALSPSPPSSPSRTPTPTPTPSPTATERVTTAATGTDDGGPPLGTLAGGVLVLGVAGGAVVAGRRRRRP